MPDLAGLGGRLADIEFVKVYCQVPHRELIPWWVNISVRSRSHIETAHLRNGIQFGAARCVECHALLTGLVHHRLVVQDVSAERYTSRRGRGNEVYRMLFLLVSMGTQSSPKVRAWTNLDTLLFGENGWYFDVSCYRNPPSETRGESLCLNLGGNPVRKDKPDVWASADLCVVEGKVCLLAAG